MQTLRAAPARRRAPRLRTLAILGFAASLVAVFAAWSWGRLHPAHVGGGDAVAAGRAELITRRVEVAFADAETAWRRTVGRSYRPATVVFFTGATPSSCAGGVVVSGPFYCPETGAAAFDLKFLDRLGERLGRERELGLALVAGRVAAEHLQRETGLLDVAALELIGARRARRGAIGEALALQADCLTGFWAALAAGGLGPVPDDFYGQLVWSARNVSDDLAREGVRVPPEFSPFAAARQEARAAAFLTGYRAGAASGCPAPTEIGAAG